MAGRPVDEPDIDSPLGGTRSPGGGMDGQDPDGDPDNPSIEPEQSPVPSPRAETDTLLAAFSCSFACDDQRHASGRAWHLCAGGDARVKVHVCRSRVDTTILNSTF